MYPKNTSVEKLLPLKKLAACVAGFVETSPGKGTLDIFFPSDFSPDVQSIEDVSIEVAEKVTNDIGRC